ncbi:MAG: hypothetical protein VB858_02990 [Planctomycetaceae bacterium]
MLCCVIQREIHVRDRKVYLLTAPEEQSAHRNGSRDGLDQRIGREMGAVRCFGVGTGNSGQQS